MNHYLSTGRQLLHEAAQISLKLFRIMVPVILVVKVLKELGAVEFVGGLLAPAMDLLGLPGSMGLVLATTMATSIYGGMVAFVSLCNDQPLTVAQATVVTSMMLIAHSLPVELGITLKAGVRVPVMGLIRVLGAFVLGWCLNQIYARGHWLQGMNEISWAPPDQDPSLLFWIVGQIKALAVIYLVILGLLVMLRVLERAGITRFLIRCLQPVLGMLGIGGSASTLTIIGMTLGLAYGGGLIIQQAKSGHIHRRDIFFALALMGLSHSLVEDTLLMALLGGHVSGILWGRVLFSLVCVYVLVKGVSRLSDSTFDRYVFLGEDSACRSCGLPGLRRLFAGKKEEG